MSENQNELKHYGVLGMKWGVRRYENKDGTLTEAGKKHYAKTGESGYHYHSHATKKYRKKASKAEQKGDTEKAAKYRRREERHGAIDKQEEEYARSHSVGQVLAARFLTGGASGGKGYAIRAGIKAERQNKKIADLSDKEKIRSIGRTYMSQLVGPDALLGFHAGARHMKRKYAKEPEREERKKRNKALMRKAVS